MTDSSSRLDEYDRLLRQDLKLKALEALGVDNWDFYDDAMDQYRKWLKEYNGGSDE